MARILFCSSFINTSSNGAAIFAQVLRKWAKSRNYELDIISREGSPFIPLVKKNKLFSKIPVIESYQRSFIYFKSLELQIKRKSYNLILFNNIIESLHSARFIKDIPVYGFLHDENFMNDYKKKASLKRRLYRNAMYKLEKKACKHLDLLLTNSSAMRDLANQHYSHPELKVDFLYFRPLDLPDKKAKLNSKNILFIKHDYERGNLSSLVQAIHLLKDPQISVHIIGPPKESHSKIKKALGSISHVIHEYVPRKKIFDFLSSTSVLCVPSHSEALGLSFLEAIHLGIPVVSSSLPATTELNKNNIYNLVPKDDVEQLAKALQSALMLDSRTLEKIENGMKFTRGPLSEKSIFHQLDQILIGNN